MSSNSSLGSLVTPAAAGDFFDSAAPVVTVERSAEMIECERNVVATASRATATNPEINRRFMENSVGSICSGWLAPPQYGQRPRLNVAWVTYHDLVYGMGPGSIRCKTTARPLDAELN